MEQSNLKQQDFIRGPFALVSPEKDRFIIWAAVKKIPYIVSFFDVNENGVQPSLSFDINRLFRAQKMLKRQPNLFVLKSDGKKLEIDAVHKLITIENPASGIIQYHITDQKTLSFEIDNVYRKIEEKSDITYIVVESSDQTIDIPENLQVLPLMCKNGFMISIADSVEKVLYLTINNSQGLIGFTEQHELRRITNIQKMWPELDLIFSVKDEQCSITSELLKNHITENCVLRLHRNFGSNDIEVQKLFTND